MAHLHPAVRLEKVPSASGPRHALIDTDARQAFALGEHASALLALLGETGELAKALHAFEARFGEPLGDDEVTSFLGQANRLGWLADGASADERRRRLRAVQDEERAQQLAQTLRYAARELPYYRQRFSETADLSSVPYLRKRDIQLNFPDGFVPAGMDVAAMQRTGELKLVRSSGTSGDERLQVLRDQRRADPMVLAGTLSNRNLWSLVANRSPRLAIFTTLNCVGIACIRDMPAMDSRILDGTLLNLLPPEDPTAPTKKEVEKLFLEIETYGVEWLLANPTYLAAVTYLALDEGMEIPQVKAIEVNYEYLTLRHRALLERTWRCPLVSSYGQTEINVRNVVQCEKGGMHVNERYLHWEIVRDGQPVRPGEVGHLVVTVLRDRLPLIRYLTMDLVQAGDDGFCECGAINRTLGALAGRARDLTLDLEGQPVTVNRLDAALSKVEGVRGYQLSQDDLDDVTLQVVPDRDTPRAQLTEALVAATRSVLGEDVEVRVNYGAIPPEPSGKFRLAKSALNVAEALAP